MRCWFFGLSRLWSRFVSICVAAFCAVDGFRFFGLCEDISLKKVDSANFVRTVCAPFLCSYSMWSKVVLSLVCRAASYTSLLHTALSFRLCRHMFVLVIVLVNGQLCEPNCSAANLTVENVDLDEARLSRNAARRARYASMYLESKALFLKKRRLDSAEKNAPK